MNKWAVIIVGALVFLGVVHYLENDDEGKDIVIDEDTYISKDSLGYTVVKDDCVLGTFSDELSAYFYAISINPNYKHSVFVCNVTNGIEMENGNYNFTLTNFIIKEVNENPKVKSIVRK